jgi:glutamate synthase (NADPH/NADH) large chain
MVDSDEFTSDDDVVAAYRKGVAKGMLKVMAKMGISTLQSYKGAQIFEALGLADEVINRCFVGTASRLQGVGFSCWKKKPVAATHSATAAGSRKLQGLPNPGEFHWRSAGERHAWSRTHCILQVAARTGSKEAYRQFAAQMNGDARTANARCAACCGCKPAR